MLRALRSPRARYSAERTAQLSGIPRSTIYDWQRSDVYRPDFVHASPMMWSYRDLVYLRVLAWLRSKGMERAMAAGAVVAIKSDISKGQRIVRLRADRRSLIANDELANRISGEDPLPGLGSFLQEFDLLEPVADFERPEAVGSGPGQPVRVHVHLSVGARR